MKGHACTRILWPVCFDRPALIVPLNGDRVWDLGFHSGRFVARSGRRGHPTDRGGDENDVENIGPLVSVAGVNWLLVLLH